MAQRNKLDGSRSATLLSSTTITTAVAAQTGTAVISLVGAKVLVVEAVFTYGSGGTSAKVWVQTRVAGGTWRDIMNLAFTTSSATKWSKVSSYAAMTAAQTASDAALSDDTILDGLLGSEVRVKYTTTGTYAGGTTLAVRAAIKG